MNNFGKTSDEAIHNVIKELYSDNNLIQNGVKNTIHELFLDLKNHNMVRKKIITTEKWEYIKAKMNNSSKIIATFSNITTTNQWEEYQLQNKNWFTGYDLRLIISNLYVQYLLESIEYDRMLLVNILNIEKNNKLTIKNCSMTRNSNLSHIAKFFDIIFNKTKYVKLLHNPLRNAIAHGDYFWKQNMLTYVDKEEHIVPTVEIMNNILEAMCIGVCITREIRHNIS